MESFSLTHLAKHVLRKDLVSSVNTGFAADAREFAHLAEFNARGQFLDEGYPSMHAFCVGVLGYSDDEAFARMRVASAAHEFPAIYPMIQDRRLNQTAVLKLAPKLTKQNAEELLAAAAGRTIGEIALLLAERFPRPDLAPIVRALAPMPAESELSLDGAVAPQRQEAACEMPSQLVSKRVESVSRRSRVTPLSPGRFGVELSIGTPTHEKLRYAQALAGHSVPQGDLEKLFDRAMDAYVEKLEKQRFAASSRPRPGRGSSNPRHIPAKVKRVVWERDGGQCTFVSETGHRCEARSPLQFDHVIPIAKGGKTTPDNLRLLCRAHNQHAADRAFGKGFMDEKRRGAQARAAAARAQKEAAQAARAAAQAARAEAQAAKAQVQVAKAQAQAAKAQAQAAKELAKAAADAELAAAGDVIPGLEILGYRPDELRLAAARVATMPDATTERRMYHAIRRIGQANAHRLVLAPGSSA